MPFYIKIDIITVLHSTSSVITNIKLLSFYCQALCFRDLRCHDSTVNWLSNPVNEILFLQQPKDCLLRLLVESHCAVNGVKFIGIIVKSMAWCWCFDGHIKEPYEMSMARLRETNITADMRKAICPSFFKVGGGGEHNYMLHCTYTAKERTGLHT